MSIDKATLIAGQVARVDDVNLAPVDYWREELAAGKPLRMEYRINVILQHGETLLKALVRVPTTASADGLSVTPLGIESGSPLIPCVDSKAVDRKGRKRGAARPLIEENKIVINDLGLPVADEDVPGVESIPHLTIRRFVPCHSAKGIKFESAIFTPKTFTDANGVVQHARTSESHGSVQVGYLDLQGEPEFVDIPRFRAAGVGATSLLATKGAKVPAFALA